MNHRLSDAQYLWLRTVQNGRDPSSNFNTSSHYGGAAGTAAVLRRHAYLDEHGQVTLAGSLAIANYQQRQVRRESKR